MPATVLTAADRLAALRRERQELIIDEAELANEVDDIADPEAIGRDGDRGWERRAKYAGRRRKAELRRVRAQLTIVNQRISVLAREVHDAADRENSRDKAACFIHAARVMLPAEQSPPVRGRGLKQTVNREAPLTTMAKNEIIQISSITDRTPVSIRAGDETIAMSVTDVLKWVAPDAPPHEALKFLMVCRAAQVNPFLGEAHLVPLGPKWATIIDKSGWLKRAEMHPQYDGHQAGIVIQELDSSAKPPKRGAIREIEGALLPQGNIVIGGWARIYRKDRGHPTYTAVSITEYKKDTVTWNHITCTMIRKVALVQALRESGLVVSGGYDAAEMPTLQLLEAESAFDGHPLPPTIDAEFERVELPTLPPGLASEVDAAIRASGMTDFQVKAMLARRGVESIVELDPGQAREIIGKLSGAADQANAGQILLPDPAPDATGNDEEAIDAESFAIADAPRRP